MLTKGKDIIKEGLSDRLYHFTSLQHGFKICRDNVLRLQSAFAKDADNYDKKRKYYLSCTRIRNSQFGYSRRFSGGGVRIEFDGRELSNRFKGKSINYWNGLGDKFNYYNYTRPNYDEILRSYDVSKFKKENPNYTEEELRNFINQNYNRSSQEHVSNESEDRLFSYEPTIEDVGRYIISIDVLIPKDMENAEAWKNAFAFKTALYKKTRIFDSLEEFNKINGRYIDKSEIEYSDYNPTNIRRNVGYIENTFLEALVSFIAFGNKDFEGNKLGQRVANLLKKYELTNFKSIIPNVEYNLRRYGYTSLAEKLDACRRDLSDDPTENGSKIMKMFSDYAISMGANSFRDLYNIKSKEVDYYFSKLNGRYASDRIDTLAKYRFIVNERNYTISLYPKSESFKEFMGWDDEYVKYNANAIAWDVFNEKDKYPNVNSKNETSLYNYLYSLFLKGTVWQVYTTLKKFGFEEGYLEGYGIEMGIKDLDYYDASRYRTIKSREYEKKYPKRYDSYKVVNDEVEEYFRNKQQK